MLRVLFFLLISSTSFGQSSQNVTFLDHWSEDTLTVNSTNVRYNECWGFVQNGVEYAVAGSTEGTHFFRLTEDDKLELVYFVEGRYNNSMVIHRDYDSYQNYLYAVCDEGQSSLQIMDVSFLPDSVSVVAENDSTFSRVHNLCIDTANALMYACIITPSVGGMLSYERPMQVYSLADPLNPTFRYEGPSDIPEVHDAYVRDNIAYLNCGFDGLRVYNFSNPTSPVYLQNLSFYQHQGYNHQGWLTPDGTKYVFGDETTGKRLKICSVANNQVTVYSSFGTNFNNNSVPHNVMVTNDFAYVAYYNEGLRIYDIRTTPPREIAHYDTYPVVETLYHMRGAWGVYPDFPSGRIIVSDRTTGLYLVDFREELFEPITTGDLSIFPNPIVRGDEITFQLFDSGINEFTASMYDLHGRIIYQETIFEQSFAEVQQNFAPGIYTLLIEYDDYLGDRIRLCEKFMIR